MYQNVSEFLFYADETLASAATNCSLSCDTHIFETNTVSDFEMVPVEAAKGEVESAVVLSYFFESTAIAVTEENLA